MEESIGNHKKDKWVLVTGASTGIGLAIAEYLAGNGYHVYANARKEEDIKRLGTIPNVFPLQFDVARIDQVKEAFEVVKQKGTGLYAIVNNAGIAIAGALMDISVEEIKEQFDVSVFGVHRVTQTFFPLVHQSHGKIIMISSDSGFFATPFFGAYCSSKFALEGYSDSLRRELMFTDVQVVIVEPGRISTPIWNKGRVFIDKYPNSLWAKYIKELGEYVIAKGNNEGLPPVRVAELVKKIMEDPEPKTRYLIAPKTFKYKLIKKVLSDKYIDKMLYKELK